MNTKQIVSSVKNASRALKAQFAAEGGKLSLKEFARRLAARGSQLAKTWLENKAGAQQTERSEKNKLRIAAEKGATKAAKKSKKTAGKSSAKTAATTVASKPSK